MKTRLWVGVLTTGLFGCGATGTPEVTEQDSEGVVNGTTVINNVAAMAMAFAAGPFHCSAVLIHRNWALTARHCVAENNTGPIFDPPSQLWTTRYHSPGAAWSTTFYKNQLEYVVEFHPTAWQATNGARDPEDVALVQLRDPETGWWPLYNGYANTNLLVSIMGYGSNTENQGTCPPFPTPPPSPDGGTGFGTLRQSSDMAVMTNAYTTFTTFENGLGQFGYHGDSGGPTVRSYDVLGRAGSWVIGINQSVQQCPNWPNFGATTMEHVDALRSWIKRGIFVPGDVNGDGKSDITLTAGPWTTLPYGLSNGDGTFSFSSATNPPMPNFPGWATVAGAKPVSGDFNGDGLNDVALTGGGDWWTIPVATGNLNGTFTETNWDAGNFPTYAALAGALPVSGDFDGDGRDDIALTGGINWTTIPIAFSQGGGKWSDVNNTVPTFPGLASQSGAKPITGDFDGDSRDDIAAVGGSSWTTIPYAFSNGDGTFTVLNYGQSTFAGYAKTSGALPVTGDFDGDGRTDIALVGGANWTTIPVAFSHPVVKADGHTASFEVTVTNKTVSSFPSWSRTAGVKVVAGDFDGDRVDDIALLGVSTWTGVRVAFSNRDGTFRVVNLASTDFTSQAARDPAAKPLSNHATGH
jgi:hypothetical protein